MKGWKQGLFLVASLLLLFGCADKNRANEQAETGDTEVLSSVAKEEADVEAKISAEEIDKEEELSYLIDKDVQLVYQSELEGGLEVTYSYLEPYDNAGIEWDMWLRQAGKTESSFLVMENEEGLFIGYPESEYYQQLVFPLEVGATFNNFEEIFTTIKVDETMTTPAGTFEDVVAVESPDHYITYYAPHVGTIKTVDADGKTTFELIEIID